MKEFGTEIGLKYDKKFRWAVDLASWILENSTFYEYGEDVDDFSYKQLQQIVRGMKKGDRNFHI
jgi:hypothetical protein